MRSNISQFDAGFWASPPYTDHDLSVLKKVPVCGLWMAFKNDHGTVLPNRNEQVIAASQLQPPATDTYIDTKNLKSMKQSIILHEVLHNLTGLLDATDPSSHLLDLKTFVGIPSAPGGTDDIGKQLELNGCVNPK